MKKLVILAAFVGFLAVSCENEMVDSIQDVESKNVETQVARQLQELPDPSLEEVQTAMASTDSSSLKSASLKSASVSDVLMVEVQRLDSAYFVSNLTRRYFVKVTDEHESEIKLGYMYQTFESLGEDGLLGDYRILFSWGLSESDKITKKVEIVSNMTERYNILFTSTTGISLRKEKSQGEFVLLPPIRFDVTADVTTSDLGTFGCVNTWEPTETKLVLDVELQSNIEAVVRFTIPSDMQQYAGIYWVDARNGFNGSENTPPSDPHSELHVHRSYSVASGQKVVEIALPFEPTSMSVEVKLLKQGRWKEMGLFYGSTFTFIEQKDGVNYYQVSMIHL